MSVWIQFLISAGVVVYAGTKLSAFADVIASKSRLGALWIGSILLALGTSLPEVVAGISAGLMGSPDLAVGNVLGSNIFNVVIIVVVDLPDGRYSILRKVSLGHLLSGTYGMLLSVIVAIAIFIDIPYHVGWIGVDTIFVVAAYLFGLRMISRYQTREAGTQPVILADGVHVSRTEYDSLPDMSVQKAYVGFAVNAVIIAGAGTMLTLTSEQIAVLTGLGTTFVGSTLLAISTSLPEIVASVAAVKAGALDLAVGNVLGSNIFNMVILLLSDLAYTKGPLLSAASDTHLLTALSGLLLSTIVVIGLFYRSERSYSRLGPDSVFILLGYGLSAYLLYVFR